MTAPSEQAKAVDKAILDLLTHSEGLAAAEVRHAVHGALGGSVRLSYVRDRLNALVASGELDREEDRQPHPLKPGALRTIQVWRKVRP